MSNPFYHWARFSHQRYITTRLRNHVVKTRRAYVYWTKLRHCYMSPSITVISFQTEIEFE